MSLFAVVEGHGEDGAIRNLIARVAAYEEVTLPYMPGTGVARKPIRTRAQLEEACEIVRRKPEPSALLLTRDADGENADPMADCPRMKAPEAASWVRDLQLPFPSAIVMFRWEYESMFLAGLSDIAGKVIRGDDGIERPGVVSTAVFHNDPDITPRAAKGWLTQHMPEGVAYKPAADQLAVTRLLDLSNPKLNELPSFIHLRRAVRFLAEMQGIAGAVYPPPLAP